MFMLIMPKTFKVGDTVECCINGTPRQVTWRDETTLVIEPGDARVIVTRDTDRETGLTTFSCGDRGKGIAEYRVEPNEDGQTDHDAMMRQAQSLMPRKPLVIDATPKDDRAQVRGRAR